MKSRPVILVILLVAALVLVTSVYIYMGNMPTHLGVASDKDLMAARQRAGFTNDSPQPAIVQTPMDYSKRVRVSIGTLGLRGNDDSKVAALALANLSPARGVEMIEREELEKALQEIRMNLDGFVRAKDAIDVGHLIHADWFVFGSWYTFNGSNSVVIRIVDAHTGILRTARFLDGDSTPIQMAADLAEIVTNARTLATTTNPPVFVGLSGFDNVGVNDRLADFPQQLRAGLTAEYQGSSITLVERERVGFLLHEMALDAAGFAEPSSNAPVVPQPAFWIVSGSYQSYETAQRKIELHVEIDQVFGTLREKTFQAASDVEAVATVKSFVDQIIAQQGSSRRYSKVSEARWYVDAGQRIAQITRGYHSTLLESAGRTESHPSLQDERNIREAMSAFQSAVLLEPTNRQARLHLAQCLETVTVGRFEEAREMLKCIVDEGVQDPWQEAAELQLLSFQYQYRTGNLARWFAQAAVSATNKVAADFYKSSAGQIQAWELPDRDSAGAGKTLRETLLDELKRSRKFDAYNYFGGLEGNGRREALDQLVSFLPEVKSKFPEKYFDVLASAVKNGADTNAAVMNAFRPYYMEMHSPATNRQVPSDFAQTLNTVAVAPAQRTNYQLSIDIFSNTFASGFAKDSKWKMDFAYTLENAGHWRDALELFETYSNRPQQMLFTGVYGDRLTLVFPHAHARHCRKELGLPVSRDPRQFLITNELNWGGPFGFSAESGSVWVGAKGILWNLSADGGRTNSSTVLPISGDVVTALRAMPDMIWLGTRASGLIAVDRRTKSVRQWKQVDGLLMDSICSLTSEGNTLWIGYGKCGRDESGVIVGEPRGGLGYMEVPGFRLTSLGHSISREIGGGPETFVGEMVAPSQNELWYTAGSSLFHYLGADHSHTPITADIHSVSGANNVLAATGNRQNSPLGLTILDPQSKKWIPILDTSGAPIGGATLVRVLNGSVWIGGLGFVASIDLKQRRVQHFGYLNSQYGVDDLQWANGELWGRKDWWLFHATVPAD